VCYNRHRVHAAGLFRFPTAALRSPFARDVALGATIAVLTTAVVGVSVASPRVLIDRYQRTSRNAPALREAYQLTAVEERFSAQLPPEQRAKYFEEKRSAWEAARSASTRPGSFASFLIGIALRLLFWVTAPGITLFAVLWFTGGRLLLRYHQALEAPDAYEVRPQPTERELAAGRRVPTPWDNRIERIRRSSDPLETEHFYLGAALEGDFPVLCTRISFTHMPTFSETPVRGRPR
ncbi:MAG: hypothetical protein WKF75_18360, partial [Singulisphaera sp.]